jgi:hypothetical protein
MPLVILGIVIGIVVTGLLLATAIELAGSFGLDLMVAGVMLVLAAVSWTVRAIARKRRWSQLRIVATAWLLLSMSGCLATFPAQFWLERRAHERGDRIAEALDRFHQREGRYPGALEELVPGELPVIPVPGQRIFEKDAFEYGISAGDYSLGHTGTAFTWCTRTARDPEWVCRD